MIDNELKLIGQAKRAPHWGVQLRFRVILCVCVGMSVMSKMRRRNHVAHANAQSQFWEVKNAFDTRVIDFNYALEQL